MSNLFTIIYELPPGTVVRLEDDYPGECHEVAGYEWHETGGYIIFKDGSKLNMKNLNQIVEILKVGKIPCGNVEYNVKVRANRIRRAVHSNVFRDFYESDKQNAKIEYDTIEDATKAQKAMCMLVDRYQILDVVITRKQNILYLIRKETS